MHKERLFERCLFIFNYMCACMYMCVCADASTDAQILEKGVKSPGVRVIVLSHLMWVLESEFKSSPKTVL